MKNNFHHKQWFELAEKHDRLLIEAAREHGKTQLFAITLPLLEMKLKRDIRILLISDVFDKSTERARVLREHIAVNDKFRSSRPMLKVARKNGDSEFMLDRSLILKEPTVRSTYAGGAISGGRYDLIIADDLVNYLLNSNTTGKRNKLRRWWADEVLNSIAEGGRIWVIGTRQHHDDLYEMIKADSQFHSAAYPALDETGGLGYREENEKQGITGDDAMCLWPQKHGYEALAAKRKANPDSFSRQQMLVAIPETGLVWRRELTDPAFERGKRVRPQKTAAQFLALDPGYSKRAALLAIQERTGDRIDLWGEYSFTEMDDDTIARVAVAHCKEWKVRAVYMDAEDPKLAKAIERDLQNASLDIEIVRVPFGNYKLAGIEATRWLLGSGRVSWRGETTTVYRPGGTTVEKSIFRKETRDYALDPNNEGYPLKDDDHGPDAWTAYAYKWIEAWLEADEKSSRQEEKPVDRALRAS